MVSVIDKYNINIYLSNLNGQKTLHLNRKKLNRDKPIFYGENGFKDIENKGQFIDLRI